MTTPFNHKTVHALVNHHSGTASLSISQREKMTEIAEESGYVFDLKFSTPHVIEKKLKHLLRKDPGAVMIGGGDGTLNMAANIMAGSRHALAVLPLGTFNHFAKDAGIPMDPVEAFRAALGGTVANIDLGQVNHRYFLNNSSIGLYPDAVNERRIIQRRLKVPKFIAMLAASLSSFRRYTILHLKNVDGYDQKNILTPLLFVGNNDYKFKGPAEIGRESLAGGYLSIFYTDPVSRARFLRLSLKVLLSSDMRDKILSNMVTKEFVVDSFKPHLRISADGEVFKLSPPITYHSRPGALKVVVPRKEP